MRIQKKIKTFFRNKQSSLRSRASATTPMPEQWMNSSTSVHQDEEQDPFSDVISLNEQMLCSQIPMQDQTSGLILFRAVEIFNGKSITSTIEQKTEEKSKDWTLTESSELSQDDSIGTSLALTENTSYEEEAHHKIDVETENQAAGTEANGQENESTVNWPEYHQTLELEQALAAAEATEPVTEPVTESETELMAVSSTSEAQVEESQATEVPVAELPVAELPADETPVAAAQENSIQCTPEILIQKTQPSANAVAVGAQPVKTVGQIDEDHDLRVVAEEAKDVVNSLTNSEQTYTAKTRRLSTISTASSIAAVIPYIWSNDETNGASEDQVRLLPYESDNLKDATGPFFPKRVTQAAPVRKNSKSYLKHARRVEIASLSQTTYTNPISLPAQTVADWSSLLESSFEGCLGNSSRFELEVPELSRTKTSKRSKRARACEKLKDWAHQSCEFFTLKRHRASASSLPQDRSIDRLPCPSLDQSWASRDTSIENIQQLSTIDESWIANTKLCGPNLSIFESFDSFKLAPIEPEKPSQWHNLSRYFKRGAHTVS